MHEIIRTSNAPSQQGKESDHLILTLIEKENLNAFTPASNIQISPGQLFIVDCRVSTPEQVQNWYVRKPEGTPFLLLSPEKGHLAAMGSVCIVSPVEAQYAVLYDVTTEGGICITTLGYTPLSEKDNSVLRVEPTANSLSAGYFMDATRRSVEGLSQLDITYPNNPPNDLVCEFPAAIIRSTYDITFSTSPSNGNDPDDDVDNYTSTSFVITKTPYLFLQQLANGTQNSQILIVETECNIISGKLYSDDSSDRGNAQCGIYGRLQPDPDNSSFYASNSPNDYSPISGSSSFDASMDQRIYYYDGKDTLGYDFSASATYDIEEWEVTSWCSGTALGPHFYATKPMNCGVPGGVPASYAFDKKGNIYPLTPASTSGGELNFVTFCSWQTESNELVAGSLTITSQWQPVAYRWYEDDQDEEMRVHTYVIDDDFSVDFTYVQPPG